MSMRLLFVTGSLVHGGAERHAITLMNRLAERGHECHAVYVKNDPSQLGRIRPGPGGSVQCLHAARFMDLGAQRRFAGILSRIAPTVIVAANGYALMHASLAAARTRPDVPLVCTFHTTDVQGFREQVKLCLDRPFFWRAACTVFVCHRQRRHWLMRGLGSRRNPVIHNGVDTAHFDPGPAAAQARQVRCAFGLRPEDFVIGIAAVMRPEKNHVQLVDALARVRAQGLRAHALMIGDGQQREAVERRTRELGLEGCVHITGLQQDVRPFVAACDAMALCSTGVETFSLAALEAMSLARPVIHADLGGAAEMVVPGHNGYLFPVGATGKLADCILRLARPGHAPRLGTRARAWVESRFAESVMVDRYEALLGSVSGLRMPAGLAAESG